MAVVDLSAKRESVITGNDNIVIINHFDGLRGGRSLDITGFPNPVINAGHVIIKDADGNFKPMPLNAGGTVYAALPANNTYAGYLVASIETRKAFAGIMVRGTINPKAAPFDLATILDDVKAALPLIDYQED